MSTLTMLSSTTMDVAARRRPRRIVVGVVLGHLVMLLVLYLVYWRQPRRPAASQLLAVQLVESPAAAAPAPSPAAPPTPVAAESPPPAPPVAVPTPAPPVAATPTPDPPRRTQWRPRTAEQIRQAMAAAAPPPAAAPARAAAPPAVAPADISARLLRELGASSSTTAVAKVDLDAYYRRISDVLYRAWRPPTVLTAVGERQASVSLEIHADGSVHAKHVSVSSGNPALDASVRQLLRDLATLPPLPAAWQRRSLTVEIVLRLEH